MTIYNQSIRLSIIRNKKSSQVGSIRTCDTFIGLDSQISLTNGVFG
jgi:hypothetical protein